MVTAEILEEITINLLKNCPQHIPELAHIWHQTLGKDFPDVAPSDIEKKLQFHCNADILPLTVVALCGTTPVGMCSLRESEGPHLRPDLVPRVASLVVSPLYQRRGIGRMLMHVVVQKSNRTGV